MREAKYYVYRNLHTNTFSVKYKGKVIDHPTAIFVSNPEFVVNELGRQRVIREKRKNVHAYVTGTGIMPSTATADTIDRLKWDEVYYNPYKTDSFINTRTNHPIHKAQVAMCLDNKVYALRESDKL